MSRSQGILFLRNENEVFKWFEHGDEDMDGKYVGEIEYGEPNGQGTYTFSNGDKYIGKWRNDQLFEGTVHTDARNCALRLITNYYLSSEDACYKN